MKKQQEYKMFWFYGDKTEVGSDCMALLEFKTEAEVNYPGDQNLR